MRKEDQIYSATRKYLLAFCDLFNDTFVIRYNDLNDEITYKRVPLIIPYSEKWYAYQSSVEVTNERMNPDALFELGKTLPSLFIGDVTFKRNMANQHNKFELVKGVNRKIFNPVSYQLGLKIQILTNLLDDNFQILEQILPGFAPSYSINVNPIPGIIENESVPISAGDPTITFPFDMDKEGQRLIKTEIPFDMTVNYYPEYYLLVIPNTTLEVT